MTVNIEVTDTLMLNQLITIHFTPPLKHLLININSIINNVLKLDVVEEPFRTWSLIIPE